MRPKPTASAASPSVPGILDSDLCLQGSEFHGNESSQLQPSGLCRSSSRASRKPNYPKIILYMCGLQCTLPPTAGCVRVCVCVCLVLPKVILNTLARSQATGSSRHQIAAPKASGLIAMMQRCRNNILLFKITAESQLCAMEAPNP